MTVDIEPRRLAGMLTKVVAGLGTITLKWKAPSDTGSSALIAYEIFVGTASNRRSSKVIAAATATERTYVLGRLRW